MFSFDSDGVLLSEAVVVNFADNILRQGYYTYKNKDTYNQIKGILDEYAKKEKEKRIKDKYEIKANELKISDLEILYTATFSDSTLTLNSSNKRTWGICRYKYENIEYYADQDMISDWAVNAVYDMREMGIMVGTSDTEFSPKDTYTAEQAIATVIRLYTQK